MCVCVCVCAGAEEQSSEHIGGGVGASEQKTRYTHWVACLLAVCVMSAFLVLSAILVWSAFLEHAAAQRAIKARVCVERVAHAGHASVRAVASCVARAVHVLSRAVHVRW